MRLLPINIPPTLRVNWVSDEARAVWEPRIQAAAAAAQYVEEASVREGLREATTQHVSPERLAEKQQQWLRDGLTFLPLRQVGTYRGFAHQHPSVQPGRPWDYYGVLTRSPHRALMWAAAEHGVANHDVTNHAVLGELLGYPVCCTDAFIERWAAGYVDPIWQQAEASVTCSEPGTTPEVCRIHALHPETSVMLRYLGIRAVFHLPCRWDCPDTVRIAQDFQTVAEAGGYADGWHWLLTLLAWPISWEAYKGLAIIRTPAFRLIVNSVPCYPTYEVQYLGQGTPEIQTRGLRFPYLQPQPLWLVELKERVRPTQQIEGSGERSAVNSE